MQHPTIDDILLIKTVIAHLKQLSVLSYTEDEASIRVASTSLRALLVEGMLERAWRVSCIGGPMTFRTWSIISVQGDDVIAFCGGGEMLPGMAFSTCWNAKLAELTFNLKDFCKRPRIQIGAEEISTVELIKYVANTLGGVHFDPEGKSVKSANRRVFDLLHRLEAGEMAGLPLQINNRNLLHHEVLSIAQVLTRSPEVNRLNKWSAPTA